jgi:hypothetical protein
MIFVDHPFTLLLLVQIKKHARKSAKASILLVSHIETERPI